MRFGILASHPIQYQAPWFRALAKQCDLTVYFAHRQSAQEQAEAGFGVAFDWDVDLTSGYKHHFLRNVARRPSVNHYAGCDTPEIREIIRGSQITDNREPMTDNRRTPFDAFIVMGWYLKSYMQAVKACRAAGIPVLVRGDSHLRTPRPLLKRAAMEVRQRLLLRQLDGFLSPGQRHREYLRHFGVPAEKILFVPHFVDNDWFREKAEKLKPRKAEIRKEWGIPEETFVPLFVGKFIPKKRPLDLVKAAQLLLSSTSSHLAPGPLPPKLHLLFVGSGALGPELRANCNVVFVQEQGAGRAEHGPETPSFELPTSNSEKPSASFTGFLNQTEIAKAYVAADVLVLPSDGGETWGLVVNEAMACGLSAIVSDAAGCAPDLIEEGTTGFGYSMGDTEQLAQRLETHLKMQQLRHDFRPALAPKLRAYSGEAAVNGTLHAVRKLRQGIEAARQ